MVENTLHNWAPPFPAHLQDSAAHQNQNNRPACTSEPSGKLRTQGEAESERQTKSLSYKTLAGRRKSSFCSFSRPADRISFPSPCLSPFFPLIFASTCIATSPAPS